MKSFILALMTVTISLCHERDFDESVPMHETSLGLCVIERGKYEEQYPLVPKKACKTVYRRKKLSKYYPATAYTWTHCSDFNPYQWVCEGY